MKSQSRLLFISLGILALLAMPAGLAAQDQNSPAPSYTVTDLGTLGGTYSLATGINNAGKIAGAAATPDQMDGFAATAYLWSKQKGMIPLGVLGPPLFPACPTCNSGAAGVGALGQVAMGSEIATLDPNGEDFGQWDPPTPTHRVTRAVIWRNAVMTALPNLPGGNNANPFWINNLGRVSGVAENDIPDSSCSIVTPFQVRRFQPVIWGPNGSIHDLGSLGGAANIAGDINNRGEVVGTAQSPDGTVHAFKWTRQTGIQDYGAFPGAVATVPGCCHTFNDRGEIVGFSIEPTNPYGGRALMWQGKEPKDLNDFVRAPSPFLQLLVASSISDTGEITGWGVTTAGEVHAFLANPIQGEAVSERAARTAQGETGRR